MLAPQPGEMVPVPMGVTARGGKAENNAKRKKMERGQVLGFAIVSGFALPPAHVPCSRVCCVCLFS